MAMHLNADQIGERSMDNITAIAIDSAKSVFEIGLFDDTGKMYQRKRLTRSGFQKFMAEKAPRVAVGIEAAGGVHHWARWLTSLGFQVKVMPPQIVKAYRSGAHKSDRRDVLAIGEAMVRPNVPSVPVKSEAAQRLQALVRVREQAMRHAIQAQLQLRGLLAEFGIVAPKGRHAFVRFVATSLDASPEWQALDGKTRAMFASLNEEVAALMAREARADKALRQAQQADPDCRRLCSMPSIGAINATQLAALLSAPELFRSGRAFASYLGLVPGQHQSGERDRQHGLTKAGSRQARTLLMLAGHNLLVTATRRQRKGEPLDRLHAWALALATRKGKSKRNVAAAAVAARLARIAWAIMARQADYRPEPV
jgi:transposase